MLLRVGPSNQMQKTGAQTGFYDEHVLPASDLERE